MVKAENYFTGVFIGIGANLVADGYASQREACTAAITLLGTKSGIDVARVSPWYKAAPVPPSDQPWYRNAVFEIGTPLDPVALLATLKDFEERFGRINAERNAPRVLDLDILDMAGMVRGGGDGVGIGDDAPPTLPHPRMHERAFVLYPLADLAPGWVHPRLGKPVADLIEGLDPGQQIAPDDGQD